MARNSKIAKSTLDFGKGMFVNFCACILERSEVNRNK